jgi:hypothetical protein
MIVEDVPPGINVFRGKSVPLIERNGPYNYFCGNNLDPCQNKTLLIKGGDEGELETIYLECPECHKINFWGPSQLGR